MPSKIANPYTYITTPLREGCIHRSQLAFERVGDTAVITFKGFTYVANWKSFIRNNLATQMALID